MQPLQWLRVIFKSGSNIFFLLPNYTTQMEKLIIGRKKSFQVATIFLNVQKQLKITVFNTLCLQWPQVIGSSSSNIFSHLTIYHPQMGKLIIGRKIHVLMVNFRKNLRKKSPKVP